MTIATLIFTFMHSVVSQYCYSCISITTYSNSSYEFADRPDPACVEEGNMQNVTECAQNGCMVLNATFKYLFDEHGEVRTHFLLRSCGYEIDRCLDDEDLAPFIVEYEKDINAGVENGTFVGFTGDVCFCSGSNCNNSNILSATSVPLVLLLGVISFYQAMA